MAAIYELAKPDVHEMANEIMEAHHHDLKMGDQYPRLCIMMASPGGDGEGEKEPPLKLHGYPCAAIISIIPYKQRVDKRADAEIQIDADWWDHATEPQQRALLDHEITHLEILHDETGCVKTDDAGRPKLKLRLHDWQISGFRSIAERYGADAIEVVEARKFEEQYGGAVLGKGELFPV